MHSQYQPLDYSSQLVLKQQVIKKAFANFSGLPAEQIPEMGETLPSPKSWGYRTKLTPHFQAPPSGSGKGKKGEEKKEKEWEVRAFPGSVFVKRMLMCLLSFDRVGHDWV